MKSARDLAGDFHRGYTEEWTPWHARVTAAIEARDAEWAAKLDAAIAHIGTARELLSEWQSEAWNQRVDDKTSEFFGTTTIAYGCEYVGCNLPFGHRHVSGGPAEDKASP